jgi:hypothetical protein
MPAARRSGTSTPWPPKAETERTTAPRLRGSVTRDDQRVLALVGGGVEQVLGVRVLVRRDLQDQALVVQAVGHPVQLGARGLHEVDATALGGELEGLADALVVVDELLDVQRGGGHAAAQRLDDRVTADDQLGGALAAAAAGRLTALGLLGLGGGEAVLLVPLAHLGGRRRALAFQAPAPLAATADLRALLAGHAAVVRGHDLPVCVEREYVCLCSVPPGGPGGTIDHRLSARRGSSAARADRPR